MAGHKTRQKLNQNSTKLKQNVHFAFSAILINNKKSVKYIF